MWTKIRLLPKPSPNKVIQIIIDVFCSSLQAFSKDLLVSSARPLTAFFYPCVFEPIFSVLILVAQAICFTAEELDSTMMETRYVFTEGLVFTGELANGTWDF